MPTCSNCSATVNLADGFCKKCGGTIVAVPIKQRTPSTGKSARLCPVCTSTLAPDAEACHRCGAFVPLTPALLEKCPKCGKTTRIPGQNFCRFCGYNFESSPVTSTPLPGPLPVRNTRKLEKGNTLGRYEIIRELDPGGVGAVYFASDPLLDRYVVIKTLLTDDDPKLIKQIINERKFLADLRHPNIVTIYDFISDGQAGYIVMEYVNGETLSAKLDRQKVPFTVPEAIRFILGILPAFEYLAQRGYVYCDFKPQNVMLDVDQNRMKLIDFGSVIEIKHNSLPDSMYATIGFYAREFKDKPSPETDLYSICRTLAYLVSRMNIKTPEYGMPSATIYKVFEDYPALYRLLVKGTHDDPQRRFHSAQELSDQLQGVLRQIEGSKPGEPLYSHHFVSRAMAPRGASGCLLGETQLEDSAIDSLHRGDEALRNRNYDVATNAYMESRRKNPESIDAYTRLVETYIEQGNFKEAQNQLEHARQSTPYRWKVSWYMGRLHEAQGKYSEARDQYTKVREDLPGELQPQQAIAFTEFMQGNYPLSIELYEGVLKADPNNMEAIFGAADAYTELKDWEGAIRTLDKVDETVARYVDAQLRICEIQLNCIQPVTAERIRDAAATMNKLKGKSVDPRFYLILGDVYYAARKLALEGKIPPGITIEGPENNGPRTLGKEAYESYMHYLRREPDPINREDIMYRKLEVAPWRSFLLI